MMKFAILFLVIVINGLFVSCSRIGDFGFGFAIKEDYDIAESMAFYYACQTLLADESLTADQNYQNNQEICLAYAISDKENSR